MSVSGIASTNDSHGRGVSPRSQCAGVLHCSARHQKWKQIGGVRCNMVRFEAVPQSGVLYVVPPSPLI